MDTCDISLVESIPEGLVYNTSVTRKSTYQAWMVSVQVYRNTCNSVKRGGGLTKSGPNKIA